MDVFLMLAKEFGPVGAVAAYFAWRDLQKSKRISRLEQWTRRVLMRQLRKSTVAIERNNDFLERFLEYGYADKS